jgi:hypothetical protein
MVAPSDPMEGSSSGHVVAITGLCNAALDRAPNEAGLKFRVGRLGAGRGMLRLLRNPWDRRSSRAG